MCHTLRREAQALIGEPPEWSVCAARAREHAKAERWGEAIAEYTKAIGQAPRMWELWQGRAGAYMNWGDRWAAIADFNKAIELSGRCAGLRRERGDLLARHGEWAEAEQDFAVAVEVDPAGHWHWYRLAALRGYLGDQDGLRETCKQALQRFADTERRDLAERTAKMCLLLPGAVDDVEAVARLADRAVAAGAQGGLLNWWQNTKALAEHRRGRFTGAIAWARKSQEGGGANVYLPALNDLMLAMAHHRLDRGKEAQQYLEKARQHMAATFPDVRNGATLNWQWHDWLMCHILLREAEATLGQAGAPPAGQKGDPRKPGKQE
jgi:Tfp pilus assembly protein PilF